jgi:hypothetical protein
MHVTYVLAFVCVAFQPSHSQAAPTLLIEQRDPYLGYGYGLSSWDNMTAALDAVFGASNITVWSGSLDSVPNLSSYTSLWITAASPGDALSAAEQSALSTYIGAGHQVALIGENNAWSSWNNSILAPVGGSYSGTDTSDSLTPAVSNSLTAGVTSLTTLADGIAVGGTSLFTQNVATLWGAGNVVSLLSVNVIDDSTGSTSSNRQFETNLANVLLPGSPIVPEPSSLTLLATAALTGAACHGRRRAKRSSVTA